MPKVYWHLSSLFCFIKAFLDKKGLFPTTSVAIFEYLNRPSMWSNSCGQCYPVLIICNFLTSSVASQACSLTVELG